MTVQKRRFTVAPTIIQHLIRSQAGTCGKAVAEAIMNSIDALANTIDITITAERLVIKDDGHGFRTEDEILQCFEVFGFDHEGMDRTYGKFGLGRGQLWNFCRTTWRTRTFEMYVDVRNRGLDYDLRTGLADHPGLIIDAGFYETLNLAAKLDLEREIEMLCKYCAIPVTVNGRLVSKDPTKEKWTVETEEAFIKVSEGSGLKVYNQGIYVSTIYAGQTGISGTLITKRGSNLKLNIARNDILRAECDLWKRLHAICANEFRRIVVREKTARVTDEQRDFLARESGDPDYADNLYEPIFTLTNGKHVGLDVLLEGIAYRYEGFLTVDDAGSRIAEQINRRRQGKVIAHRTLERFGVEKVEDLIHTLIERMPASCPVYTGINYKLFRTRKELENLLGEGRFYEDIKQAPAYKQLTANAIPEAELNPAQVLLLRHLNDLGRGVFHVIHSLVHKRSSGNKHPRKVMLGRSEECDAFTDGESYIVVVDEVAKKAAQKGIGGFVMLANLMLHEYLHDSDDSGSHVHDVTFFEDFHEIAIDHAADLFEVAASCFTSFAKSTSKMTKKQAKALDTLAIQSPAMS